MLLRNSFSLMALLIVAACGRVGNSERLVEPTTQAVASNAFIRFAYDPNNQTLEKVAADGSIPREFVTVFGLPSSFDAFWTEDASSSPQTLTLATAGRTPSGGGQVVSEIMRNGDRFYSLERLSPTLLPGSDAGAMRYSGDYGGMFLRTAQDGSKTLSLMFGDVEIDVEFMTSNVSGTISGRQSSAGALAGDVTLTATNLVDGGFGGTAAGGSFPGGSLGEGEYNGLMVGPNGEELVGNIALRYFSGEFSYSEFGSIIAIAE